MRKTRLFNILLTLLLTTGLLLSEAPAAAVAASPVIPSLRLAYMEQNQLHIREAGTNNLAEHQITLTGKNDIIGWSRDGNWLAFQQWTAKGKAPYLWVISKDGEKLQQLSSHPIDKVAGWSANRVAIAYSSAQNDQWATAENNLILSELVANRWVTRELVAAGSEASSDLTWLPDGKSLALALNRTLEAPIRVDRIYLDGQRKRLVTVKGNDLGQLGDDTIFIQGLNVLTFSPNGRYLAAFLASNSPSYNTAGMPLSIIDTKREHRVTVGKGLGYPGWLAWSNDSKRLAFIDGLGRSATTNKRLYLATVGQGRKVTKVGKKGLIDCRPWWLSKAVYFARATETETWDTNDKRVPGQQIMRWKSGKVTPVTIPGNQASDFPLSLSPNGKNLAFLRLTSSTRGELCTVDLKTGSTSQIMNKLPGDGGYYGNFYPDWVSIYWLAQPER